MLFIFFLIPIIGFSQASSLKSYIDTNNVHIGDVLIWTVEIEGDSSDYVFFPSVNIETDSLIIRKQHFITKNKQVFGVKFELIAWDTGSFMTPEYKIHILNSDSTFNYALKSPPVRFNVNSLLLDSVITDFLPIKDPLPVKSIFPIKLTILIIIFMASIVCLLLVGIKRQKNRYIKNKYVVIEDPKKVALRRIKAVNESGLIKDVYAEFSHISRQYIELKYFVRTLEMTTEEISSYRSFFNINNDELEYWINFLNNADKIKYAKEISTAEEMRSDRARLITFINNT